MIACRILHRTSLTGAMLLFLAILGLGQNTSQEKARDHSCSAHIAGEFVKPSGEDGSNFNTGWGLQAGGGFAVSQNIETGRGVQWFVTANYMYAKLNATAGALAFAKTQDPAQLANATSAHGSFSVLTIDPVVRFPMRDWASLYALAGFGWLRRGIGFNDANPANLIQSSASSLARLSSNSGVFDFGGGINFSLSRPSGLMPYVEVRFYHGAAINSSTTLVPVSFGVRW